MTSGAVLAPAVNSCEPDTETADGINAPVLAETRRSDMRPAQPVRTGAFISRPQYWSC